MFYRMEQLSKLQIQGFFLQLSEEGKKSDGSVAIQSEIGVKQ